MSDHWTFLEECEAPMWADLKLEANAYDLDIFSDDDWFERSHYFHQCSARQLKSTFFHPAKGSKAAGPNFQEASSPKVPSSVSRSRGKDYRSRKWRENCMLGNQHPVKDLSAKTFFAKSGFNEVTTLKSSITFSKGSSSGTSIVDQANPSLSNKENKFKPLSGSSSYIVDNIVEGNTSSTVTSESIRQEHSEKVKVKNHAFGSTSELLKAMKASLRKSFTTGQAIRIEVKDTGQQIDCKSLSGKSSVGSCSNPHSHGRSRTSTARSIHKKGVPESRNIYRMTQAATNKVKVQVDKREFNLKGSDIGKKSINVGVAKSKALNEKLCGRVPPSVEVSKQSSVTAATKFKEKSGVSKLKGHVAVGKENVVGKIVASQRRSSRMIAAGTTSTVLKESSQILMQRSDKTTSSKGKITEVTRGKNLLKQKLPFR